MTPFNTPVLLQQEHFQAHRGCNVDDLSFAKQKIHRRSFVSFEVAHRWLTEHDQPSGIENIRRGVEEVPIQEMMDQHQVPRSIGKTVCLDVGKDRLHLESSGFGFARCHGKRHFREINQRHIQASSGKPQRMSSGATSNVHRAAVIRNQRCRIDNKGGWIADTNACGPPPIPTGGRILSRVVLCHDRSRYRQAGIGFFIHSRRS